MGDHQAIVSGPLLRNIGVKDDGTEWATLDIDIIGLADVRYTSSLSHASSFPNKQLSSRLVTLRIPCVIVLKTFSEWE